MIHQLVIPHAIVDGGSGVNVMSYSTFTKLGLSFNGVPLFGLRMGDHCSVQAEDYVQHLPITMVGKTVEIECYVLRLSPGPGQYQLLLGRPWIWKTDCVIDIPCGRRLLGRGSSRVTIPAYTSSILTQGVTSEVDSDSDDERSSASSYTHDTYYIYPNSMEITLDENLDTPPMAREEDTISIPIKGEDKIVKLGAYLGFELRDQIATLCREYQDIFAWDYIELKGFPPELIVHRIPLRLGVILVRQRQQRLPEHYCEGVYMEIKRLLEAGFIFLIDNTEEWYDQIASYLSTLEFPSEMSKAEKKCLVTHAQRFFIIEGELYQKGFEGLYCHCVRKEEIPHILKECHVSACGGHFAGRLTTLKILRAGYWWPSVFKDSFEWCKRCDMCQCATRLEYHLRPNNPIMAALLFEKWGMDYVGPITPSSRHGKSYIIGATDYLTKWSEARAVRSDDARTTATYFIDHVICHFGAPAELVSDRGTHFLNDVLEDLTSCFNIRHDKTAPYKPSTNGQVESTNKTLVTVLRKTVDVNKRDWDEKLQQLSGHTTLILKRPWILRLSL
ncbi:hypothetical protein L7F22_052003 [Adiantum nelumboides]|nr:hypothetical protein [Adiantum nelumboides]